MIAWEWLPALATFFAAATIGGFVAVGLAIAAYRAWHALVESVIQSLTNAVAERIDDREADA